MKMVVVGMGYVGTPAAALFADEEGMEVVGLQRRSQRSGWKIDALNGGQSIFPPTEPGIAELLSRVVLEKRTFRVTEDLECMRDADCVLFDVQTPVEPGDHAPRYESLREVAVEAGRRLRRHTLVSVESTVAPGTTANLVRPALEEASGLRAGQDFNLCFSYERVMVGRLLHNIREYPRIVGGYSPECAQRGKALYERIVRAPVIPTDCLSAEVAKTVENAYRDVNIAFANEVALACESLGVDAFHIRALVNNLPNDASHPSANPVRHMLLPGAGVGGHCLPKDSWLLRYGVQRYGKNDVEMPVILGARRTNDLMPIHMAALAEECLRAQSVPLSDAAVTILGYAFLEDSDDTRNTPAAPLIAELRRRGVKRIVVHDPHVRKEECPGIERDVYRALTGADCACLVTKHAAYADLDPAAVRAAMRHPILVDGRNWLESFRRHGGFLVRVVGKGGNLQ